MVNQLNPAPTLFRNTHSIRKPHAPVVDPRKDIDRYLQSMRAFAQCLTQDRVLGDALVHDAIVSAWASLNTFAPGTDVAVWLFSTERDIYYAGRQEQAGRNAGLRTGQRPAAKSPVCDSKSEFTSFRRAFDSLSDEHREALILVGPAGFSLRQAAEICGCHIDILTARVNNANKRLETSVSLFACQVDDEAGKL